MAATAATTATTTARRKRPGGTDANEQTTTASGKKPRVTGAHAPLEPVAAVLEQRAARLALARASRKFVGLHASGQGGVDNAVIDAVNQGATAFALFVRNQRKWESPPLEQKHANAFKHNIVQYSFDWHHVVPHGSYLVNLGNADPVKLSKSRNAFLDELRRSEALGIRLFNFHPGATVGLLSPEQCIAQISDGINWAHAQTRSIITVIENMSGQATTIGSTFDQLAQLISGVQNKDRVGVCLDTCHLFAAGYDIRTHVGFSRVLDDFDRLVGLRYLKAMHINDCKSSLGSHLDRHENIGRGQLGLEPFRFIMNDARFDNIPLILETPNTDHDVYRQEIDILYSLLSTAYVPTL